MARASPQGVGQGQVLNAQSSRKSRRGWNGRATTCRKVPERTIPQELATLPLAVLVRDRHTQGNPSADIWTSRHPLPPGSSLPLQKRL